jgi:hypothetical protein
MLPGSGRGQPYEIAGYVAVQKPLVRRQLRALLYLG